MLPPQDIQDRSKSSNPTEAESVHCIVYGGPNSFWVFFYRVASAVFRQPHYTYLCLVVEVGKNVVFSNILLNQSFAWRAECSLL